MRVLVTTTGYPGHVLPVVPFARACVRSGHEVCVAGPRAAALIVGELGLEFCGWTDPPEDVAASIVATAAQLAPPDGHARMIAEGFGRVATRAALPGALQLIGAWRPDLVVRESQEFAGYLAAERHGVPHVRVALGLGSTERETLALTADVLGELRAELGLPADPAAERAGDAPCLTLVPAALEHPGGSGPSKTHRFRERRGPIVSLPDWWQGSGDPLVYVTFGSVAGSLGYFPALYRALCEALADLPARVLVTLGGDGDPATLDRLPGNVHAERWVAQEAVLPHAAAVICHGGYGSLLGALAQGLPSVLIPLFAGDQWHNARRVAQLDAGIALEGSRQRMFDHPGTDVLTALPGAIRQVLDDPAYGVAARGVAAGIAQLPPVSAAPDVLRTIAQRAHPAAPADLEPGVGGLRRTAASWSTAR